MNIQYQLNPFNKTPEFIITGSDDAEMALLEMLSAGRFVSADFTRSRDYRLTGLKISFNQRMGSTEYG